MKAFRKKKKPADSAQNTRRSPRIDATRSAKPVYSYYASRETIVDRQSLPANRRITGAAEATLPVRRSLLTKLSKARGIGLLYALVFAACAVKLFLLVPHAKLIIPDSTHGQVADRTYLAATDELLRSSPLNRTKLTVDANGIARELEERFPELQTVVVTVPILGNKPVVHAAPQEAKLQLQTASALYSVNARGYVLGRLSAPLAGVVTLQEDNARNIVPGKQYLASSTVEFAWTVAYELEKGGIIVQSLRLPAGAPYELDASVKGKPFTIRFNLRADALQQSGGAVATLKQLGPNTPAQYLDVRVPGRVFYK